MEQQNGSHWTQDEVLDKIRKLLALSQSPNENEASLAMQKVQELLNKYNLDMADVQSHDAEVSRELFKGLCDASEGDWKRYLYNSISDMNFCKCIGQGYGGQVWILGRLPNVIATHEITEWIAQQITRLSILEANNFKSRKANSDGIIEFDRFERTESTRTFKSSFCMGCAQRVVQRLWEFNKRAVDSQPNLRALTVSLKAETEEYVHKEFPFLSHGRAFKVNYGSQGYASGRRSGDGVSIVSPSHHVQSGSLRLGSGK